MKAGTLKKGLDYVKKLFVKGDNLVKKDKDSRKYRIVLLIFFAATLMCICPPVVSALVMKMTAPLVILSGSEWVTVMGMVGGLYFGANVWEKKVVGNDSFVVSVDKDKEVKKEDRKDEEAKV